MNVPSRERLLRLGADAGLTALASVVAFAVAAVLTTIAKPDVPLVVVGALYTVIVLVVARYGGFAYAVPVGMASLLAIDWFYVPPTHSLTIPGAANLSAAATYLVAAIVVGRVADHAVRRAAASEATRTTLLDEQAALRRVATLVARGVAPDDVFAAVAEEVGRLVSIDTTRILRYESDGTATVIAGWNEMPQFMNVGARVTLEGENVAGRVRRTQRPARIDSFADASGSLATSIRQEGIRSAAGCPIVVEGRLWGAMVGASMQSEPIPVGMELRIAAFTELVAIAISNAEAHTELTASRSRVVAAADDTRRRIERDLHDGIQQRLVSTALALSGAEASADADIADLRPQLLRIGESVNQAADELREISRGIHPAILSEGGLQPALKALARRSPVPVELAMRTDRRLPERVEVAAYYLVSEALTNAAKHAHASVVKVDVEAEDCIVRLAIRDDGIGGADPTQGSGLIGLSDRVEALGGRIEIASPAGHGTSLLARIPVEGG